MTSLLLYLSLIFLIFFVGKHFIKVYFKLYSKPYLFNSYSDFIPSHKIINNKYIFNKNGSYTLLLRIEGTSYYEEEDIEIAKKTAFEIKNMSLNLKNLHNNINIKFIFKRFKYKEAQFLNNNYIELTTTTYKELEEVSQRLINGLSKFNPKIVESKELVQLIYTHCNLNTREITPTIMDKLNNGMSLSNFCSAVEIQFDKTSGILFKLGHQKYFKCFTLDFGNSINDKYFLEILTSTFECEYIINSNFLSKLQSEKELSIDKKNITASSTSPDEKTLSHSKFEASQKKITEIKEAQEILENEEANLIVMDAFIFIYAANEIELEQITIKLKDIISKYEIHLTEERYLLNFFFLQRLFGFSMKKITKFILPYGDSLLYARKMLTCTLAGLIDYIKTPTGLTKCDWGKPPLVKLQTNYNNLYNFYLHVNEGPTAVGHGVIIAPTGGGKTTFIQYLMKGILDNYLDINLYSFDRFNGISIFANWQNGKDISFNELAMNPLQIDLTITENIEFLNSFITMLAKAESTKDKEVINSFVNMLTDIPCNERLLKNLINECIPISELKDNLNLWCEGKYAHYFNAPVDNFTLDNRFINFQMDKVLDNEELSAPIISYIMFKIRQKARSTGRGHFIFIDETAKMLKNTFFRDQTQVLLDEHRKLRGCVWLAFQNPNAFLDDSLCQSILNQCQNRMLFSSDGINLDTLAKLQIDNNLYSELKMAQKQYNNPYFVLLKRPTENVILNINLKDKADLKFFSSSAKDVNKMKELQNEFGKEWVNYF